MWCSAYIQNWKMHLSTDTIGIENIVSSETEAYIYICAKRYYKEMRCRPAPLCHTLALQYYWFHNQFICRLPTYIQIHIYNIDCLYMPNFEFGLCLYVNCIRASIRAVIIWCCLVTIYPDNNIIITHKWWGIQRSLFVFYVQNSRARIVVRVYIPIAWLFAYYFRLYINVY